MMKTLAKKQNKRLVPGWDVSIVSLVLIAFLATASVMYYRSERKRILSKEIDELTVINSLKENHIRSWRNNQLSDAMSYSESPLFSEVVDKFMKTHSPVSKDDISKRCNIIKNYKGYKNVMIADPAGKIEMTLSSEVCMPDSTTMGLIKKVITGREAEMSRIFESAPGKSLCIDIISPVVTTKGNLIALLIMQADPATELLPEIIRDQITEKSTSNYLVFDINGQRYALKTDSTGLGVSGLRTISKTHPLYSLLSGDATEYTGIDLNNQKVIAHIQPVAGMSWHLMTLRNYDEVLSNFHTLAVIDALITSFLIMLILVSIVLIYQLKQKSVFRDLLYTELAFKEERERFRTTLYSIGDGVITTDESGFVVNMNTEASRLTGWSEESASGKHIHEIFITEDEDTGENLPCPVDKVLSDGIVSGLSSRTILKSHDGNIYPVSDSAAPIRSDKNEIIGSVLVFRNQTVQRQAEKRLRKSEADLRRAEYVSHIGHWEINPDQDIIHMSEGASSILGLDDDTVNISHIRESVLPEDASLLEAGIDRLLNGDKSMDLEVKLRRLNDLKITYVHFLAAYDETENKVFGTIQDISELKKVTRELTENKERWRSLFDNSPSAIVIYKAIDNGNDFIMEDVNKTSQDIDGINPEDVIGKSIREAFPAAENFGFMDVFRKVWQTGESAFMGPTYYEDERVKGWRDNVVFRLNTNEIVAIYNDVTERKAAELKLIESEKKFRSLFENISDIILLVDFNGKIIGANPAACIILEYPLEELSGMNISDINTEEYKPLVKERIAAVKRDGANFFETAHITKSGRTLLFEINSRVIDYDNSKLILSVYRDITQKKITENALKSSEEKFRSIFENHSAVKLLIDPETKIFTDANFAAEKFYGWKLNELRGKKITDINISPVAEIEYFLDSLRDKQQNHAEFRHRLKDGSVKDVEVYSSYIKIRGKNLIHSIVHDITARKLAESALRESELILRKSQEAAKIGSYRFNVKTKLFSSSPTLDEILGFSENKIRHMNEWVALIHPDAREEVSNYFTEEVLIKRTGFNKEYRIIRDNDKQTRWIYGHGDFDVDENGERTELFGTLMDITDQKLLEQKVLTSVVETEERERQNFSQELHDGLGPLISAIKMYIELLSMPNSKADIKNFIEKAENLINEAAVTVREISFRLSPHILQNYGVVDALKAFAEKIRKTREIEIIISSKIACKLSSITETVIYRALCECINNTIKHAGADKIAIDLKCTDNALLEVTYSDNGKGFDVEKTRSNYTGVGLLNMESRIRSINGTINIDSRINEGTFINIRVDINPG